MGMWQESYDYIARIQSIRGKGVADASITIKEPLTPADRTAIKKDYYDKLRKTYAMKYGFCQENEMAKAWYFGEIVQNDKQIDPAARDRMKEIMEKAIPPSDKLKALEKEADKLPATQRDAIEKDLSEIDKTFSDKTIVSDVTGKTAGIIQNCNKKKELEKERDRLARMKEIEELIENNPQFKELQTLGLTKGHVMCLINTETGSTFNHLAYNSDKGGKGAFGLMQMRLPAVTQLMHNDVDKMWKDKGYKSTEEYREAFKNASDNAQKLLDSNLRYKNAATETDKAAALKIINDAPGVNGIAGKNLFDKETNLSFGMAYLKNRIVDTKLEGEAAIIQGIKNYYGGTAEKKQTYYNSVKSCMDKRAQAANGTGNKQ